MEFLLTRLLRGVTSGRGRSFKSGKISTHTPLARRDLKKLYDQHLPKISTHTPLARRDAAQHFVAHLVAISTHTPLARRDLLRVAHDNHFHISTHTPLARRDFSSFCSSTAAIPFLLTRLLRGVTQPQPLSKLAGQISTHTPLARRDSKAGRKPLR